MIKYRLQLLSHERLDLLAKVQKGKASAKTIQKAPVLLASDDAVERQSETTIAATYHLATRSVERIRKDFCERGMGSGHPAESGQVKPEWGLTATADRSEHRSDAWAAR